MSALDEFATDVNGIVADLNAQFSVLNDRKLKIKQRGGEIAQKWAEHFDVQETAMKRAEDALNRISNVPLTSVPPKTAAGGMISEIPVKING
jgi:hypothetical protein